MAYGGYNPNPSDVGRNKLATRDLANDWNAGYDYAEGLDNEAMYASLYDIPDANIGGSAPAPAAPGGNNLANIGSMVGGVAQGVGAIGSIYGAYKQNEMAEKNYELAKDAYDAQVRRAEKQDAIAQEQLRKQNMMTGAQYAQGIQDSNLTRWGGYDARSGGRS